MLQLERAFVTEINMSNKALDLFYRDSLRLGNIKVSIQAQFSVAGSQRGDADAY